MSTEEFPKPLTAAGARATSAHDGPPFPPDVRDEEIAMVLEVEFPIALRGYDRTTVDAYVHKVSRLISDLEASRSPQSAIRYALEQVSEQTRAILQQAHDSADAVTSKSRVDAADRLQSAEREAAALRESAERRIRELEDEVAEIWQERERLLAEMRDSAVRMTEVVDAAAEHEPPAALTFEELETEQLPPVGHQGAEWIDDTPGATPPPPVDPEPDPDLAGAPPPLPEEAAGPVAFDDNGFDRSPVHPIDEGRPQPEPFGETPEWDDEPADGEMRLELTDAADESDVGDVGDEPDDPGPDDTDTAERQRP